MVGMFFSYVGIACAAASVCIAEWSGQEDSVGARCEAVDDSSWELSKWLSAVDSQVETNLTDEGSLAAPGTSWFVCEFVNEKAVKSVRWMTAGLGVYEVYVNRRRVGNDFLKPGFTHNAKTKYAFTYDVTDAVAKGANARNVFAAEVSAGWWRDKICTPNRSMGFFGKKSAFRGVVEVTFVDGSVRRYGTNTRDWKAGTAGPVVRAAIFDGEVYDARLRPAFEDPAALGTPEINDEFKGEILPTRGAEVLLRRDHAMEPKSAWIWKDVVGVTTGAFGTVVKARTYEAGETMRLGPGEHLVVDFGQNAAAVPSFRFRAARGTELLALPAEMLNDGNGLKSRGNDGPEGSVYRVNLRESHAMGQRVKYVFSGEGIESYLPRFTFFGYRYVSVTATAPVEIESLKSVPVTSIRADQELGRLEVGDKALNRFVQNVYWGQLSNYLSVPTDCPQRNERLGWCADTQVFAEAASFNADVYDFLCKFMKDERDSQHEKGGFPSVAPFAQYGNESMRVGWADAGVIVPYTMWKQFGDTRIVRENWAAMKKYLAHVEKTKYEFAFIPECGRYQYADWLSFEDFEACNGSAWIPGKGWGHPRPEAIEYWNYLGACYWLMDARMLGRMAEAIGETGDREAFAASEAKALGHIRANFIDPKDGLLIEKFRHLQGAALFALRCGILENPEAIAVTKAAYRKNLADHGGCNMTGFLGTSILMDTLTENGMVDVAYDLLLNHKFPSWLYSVDQGATTVWERWNSYTKDKGFGPVGMNSFNHYAYGAVLAWIYKTAAGIAADPKAPGFKNVIMAPKPDRRLGFVKAEYKSAAGLVKSAWRYEGVKWIWEFTIPEGSTATVRLPDADMSREYRAGTHRIEVGLDSATPPYAATWEGEALKLNESRVSSIPFCRIWPGRQRDRAQTELSFFTRFDLGREGVFTLQGDGVGRKLKRLLPLSESQSVTVVNDNQLCLRITSPGSYVLEFDGSPTLHVFADPPLAPIPEPSGSGRLIRFGKGVHFPGVVAPQSGDVVVLDEGAVVYGSLFVHNATNVTVTGRGIFDGSGLGRADETMRRFRRERGLSEIDTESACFAYSVYGSENVVVSGVTFRNAPFWSLVIRNHCRHTLVDNIHIVGNWRYNSDGVDVCASEDTVIRNSFFRTFDDCVIARGPYLAGESAPVNGMVVSNCVMYCDWGVPFKAQVQDMRGSTIENVSVQNCKVLAMRENAIQIGVRYGCDLNVIRNLSFEDIELNVFPQARSKMQEGDDDAFVYEPLATNCLVLATSYSLGKNLGDQVNGPMEDPDFYHFLFENFTFRNIDVRGEDRALVVRLESQIPNHVIRNIALDGLPAHEMKVTGNVTHVVRDGRRVPQADKAK